MRAYTDRHKVAIKQIIPDFFALFCHVRLLLLPLLLSRKSVGSNLDCGLAFCILRSATNSYKLTIGLDLSTYSVYTLRFPFERGL